MKVIIHIGDDEVIAEDKIEDFNKRISEIETKMSLLGNNSGTGNSGGGGPDLESLNNLLKTYMKKPDLDELLKRMDKCEQKTKKANKNAKQGLSKINEWESKW